MEDLFDGMDDAKVGESSVYYKPGNYVVEVIKCLTKKSRKGANLFIAETKILKSNNDVRPPGTVCGWIVNLGLDAALGNIKGFIGAAEGMTDKDKINEEITKDVTIYAVSNENPLAGVKLNLEVVTVTTRANTDFNVHNWSPYVEVEAGTGE